MTLRNDPAHYLAVISLIMQQKALFMQLKRNCYPIQLAVDEFGMFVWNMLCFVLISAGYYNYVNARWRSFRVSVGKKDRNGNIQYQSQTSTMT